MSGQTNFQTITQIINKIVTKTPNVEITPETHLIKDLGIDSLEQVEIVLEIEKEFDIKISDDQASTIQTIADIVKFVDKNSVNKNPVDKNLADKNLADKNSNNITQ